MEAFILKCARRMIADRTGSLQRASFIETASSTIVTIAIITRTRSTTTLAGTPRIMLIVIFACTVIVIIYTTIIAICR